MDEIIDFYRKYPFPGVRQIDQDGLILLRNLHTNFRTKDHNDNQSKWRILDAGCGTGNTSISLAKHFKEASLLGIDISNTSLSIARKAADKEKINNLFFRQWDLMEPLQNEDSFNIILCLGVLHHTADMQRVLVNLRMKLENKGELYLWIYGQYGRYHHSLNQRLLNILLKTRPLPSSPVQFASEFIFSQKNGSILEDLVGSESKNLMLKKVFENQIWIADQFLNPNEKLLDMEGIIKLLNSSGFEIKKWLCVNDDFSFYFNSQVLKNRFDQLSKYQKLIALDLLLKPDRYFMILRKK
jgi:SAM-dependent methyltransferase